MNNNIKNFSKLRLFLVLLIFPFASFIIFKSSIYPFYIDINSGLSLDYTKYFFKITYDLIMLGFCVYTIPKLASRRFEN